MKRPELQHLTASETLTLEQEYDMQGSWREDDDQYTFVVLDKQRWGDPSIEEEQCMVGDINMFLTDPTYLSSAELEIMIAGTPSVCVWGGIQCLRERLLLSLTYSEFWGVSCPRTIRHVDWRHRDSNLQPSGWETTALPTAPLSPPHLKSGGRGESYFMHQIPQSAHCSGEEPRSEFNC
uniref:N-acetyltransferase 9-like protein isoform X1 n=1 Tax=Monopterus albus TaxID=43700 RepID=UPI0009B37E4E|nr:N-acetyltransferase 9-like protein isoform X1 [Monopterus albus]